MTLNIRTKMKTALAKIIVAISMIVLFMTVSTMDYRDKIAEEKHYADMACNGYWPDYANIEPDCKTL
jgi:hypothetical protein